MPATKELESIDLLEVSRNSSIRLDKDKGIVHRVKIHGANSKNGYVYSPAALQDVARLVEGAEVNIDHPDIDDANRVRGVTENFGVLENVTVESGGVYGDLHYLKSHSFSKTFEEKVERFPQKIGLSINARGSKRSQRGSVIIENVLKINSVDLVTRPATNDSLFESVQVLEGRTVEEIILDNPDYIDFADDLLEACPGCQAGGGASLLNSPTKESELNGEDEIKEAIKKLILAALDDPEFTAVGSLAKIRDVLNAQESLLGKPGEKPEGEEGEREGEFDPAAAGGEEEAEAGGGFGEEEAEGGEEVPAEGEEEEGGDPFASEEKPAGKPKGKKPFPIKESEQYKELEKENRVLKTENELVGAGVEHNSELVESLSLLEETDRVAIIERLAKGNPVTRTRPQNSPAKKTLLESENKPATNSKDFADRIK